MTADPAWTPLSDADPRCRIGTEALASAYADRSLSPVEVAQAALDRAEQVQGALNAFTRIDRDSALAAARRAEERWRRGEPASPIDGVPTTLKDIVWVEGWSIRYGSPSTSDAPMPSDAPAVARLKAAGAVILGLTTTPEFGWKAVTDGPFSGVTRNPWNPDLTPGGSSGGAAVAAATGAGVLHLGTDGGGSIRIPSAFTGIVGHKPSYGRVPAYPSSAFGTVAHLGPMARCVADVRAMLGAMSGRDPLDWLQGPALLPSLEPPDICLAGARIGLWSQPPRGSVDPEIADRLQRVADRLVEHGAIVEIIALPASDVLETFNVHWYAGAATRAAALMDEQRARLDPGLTAVIAEGERISAVRYVQAMTARADFGRAMDEIVSHYDVLMSPATAVLPFAVGEEVPPGSGLARWIDWAGFSFPVNLTQQPACVVPCGLSRAGLPIGLQLIGGRGEDGKVLAYAAAVEAMLPDLLATLPSTLIRPDQPVAGAARPPE